MYDKKTLQVFLLTAGLSLALAVPSTSSPAEMTVMVGGAPMYPSKNIVENAVNSKDHTTLVAAVKAAALVDSRRPTRLSHGCLEVPWTLF
jgi:uncharacterized surface protein with fasciclin (FAS1) repeats